MQRVRFHHSTDEVFNIRRSLCIYVLQVNVYAMALFALQLSQVRAKETYIEIQGMKVEETI
jgi:hypothetical protein